MIKAEWTNKDSLDLQPTCNQLATDCISRQAAMAYPLSWEHYDKEHGDRKFICGVESYREYIESLPSTDEWIPCSERLPEECVSVLISVGGMYSAEGCLRWDKDWNQFRWNTIQDKEMVDAWMPLPKPYMENCDTCKHQSEPWDSEACDGCSKAHSGYEWDETINGKYQGKNRLRG